MKHNHNGFAVVIALAAIIVIGIFGLGLWRYVDTKNEPTNSQQFGPTPTPQQEALSNIPDYTLNIKELGLKVHFEDPPYRDITYTMISSNIKGPKVIAAVYSKDLLERNLKDCGEGCENLNEWETFTCNKGINVYYYDPQGERLGHPASISPRDIEKDSEIYVGFAGSCAASENDNILNEYKSLKEYLKTQIDKATDRTVTG